jgi:hypothetical protein
MLPFLFALQVTSAPLTPPLQAAPPARADASDSTRRARVDSAIVRFQREWRNAWEATFAQVLPVFIREQPNETRLRYLALHCHWLGTHPRLKAHVVTGTVDSHGTCPIWYPPDGPTVRDERHGIDGALTSTRRWRVRELRRALRLTLDSAAQALPGDAWIAAQRVRFAVDDGDRDGAVRAAAQCAVAEGFCGMLRGYVLHQAGRAEAADSAFEDALAQMPGAERCAWNELGVLLEPDLRTRYAAMSCAERASLETRLWWLSDPLWAERGNERRAEHYARKVRITMLAPLGEDERQRWRPEKGGEAVAETLLRYGWPSHFFWAGPLTDNGHDEWLARTAGVDTAQPYLVREYSRDRLHTVPDTRALLSPFEANATDWTLNALADNADWWPREHYARDAGRVIQLPIGQQAMLRRRDATRLAVAFTLDTALLLHPRGDSARVTLYRATAPDSTHAVAARALHGGRTLVIDAPLPQGPTVVGVELHGAPSRAAGRTRFGVNVLPPLRRLGDARALSPPVFIEPPADAMTAMPAEAAIARMLGSTVLARSGRVGVYWEAYGFSATDTVEITLSLSRESKPGMFERVASGFGLWGEEGKRADVRWSEVPGSGRTVVRMEGDVPVHMRSVSLDLRRQRAGRYRLEVAMRTPAGAWVHSERGLVLR